jgi:hypothetical protein
VTFRSISSRRGWNEPSSGRTGTDREDDLVLRVENRLQRHHDGLLGASRGHHVLRFHFAVVKLLGVADDGLL